MTTLDKSTDQTERTFDPTEENLATALEWAERSSHVVSYSQDDITPDDIATALAKRGPGPSWFCWTGTKEDALFVALTGNGPTSEYNAAFFSCAREIVIGLVHEVRRLRAERVELLDAATDRALERDLNT